jgi:Glycosyl transferases group 1
VPERGVTGRPLRVLCWHVHGSWSTAFVQGRHTYLVPVRAAGLDAGTWPGRPAAWRWPERAVEVDLADLDRAGVDVAVLQRPAELELLRRHLGAVPAVYLEHNTPKGDVPLTRHPLADQHVVPVVHVSHFNELMWDNGQAPTVVISHGIIDPGHRYTGELRRAAVVLNEPLRRWRVTGTDLLPRFAAVAGVDVFGMCLGGLGERLGLCNGQLREVGDLPQDRLHTEVARRRVYLHTTRWTSLGLSLLEAMALGMPVVALATTEAVTAVPPPAGVLATRVATLVDALARLMDDPGLAADMGRAAREVALRDFALGPFLDRWDELLWEVAG